MEDPDWPALSSCLPLVTLRGVCEAAVIERAFRVMHSSLGHWLAILVSDDCNDSQEMLSANLSQTLPSSLSAQLFSHLPFHLLGVNHPRIVPGVMQTFSRAFAQHRLLGRHSPVVFSNRNTALPSQSSSPHAPSSGAAHGRS